jgi:dihydroneopterin aldolase
MGFIELEGLEFYAYHGHFKEEQVVGNKFLVDVLLETDTDTPGKTDNLDDALDYQKVYRIIEREMSQKSFLIEHISKRIVDVLFEEFTPQLKSLRLKISKINPPLGGRVQKVSVITEKRY